MVVRVRSIVAIFWASFSKSFTQCQVRGHDAQTIIKWRDQGDKWKTPDGGFLFQMYSFNLYFNYYCFQEHNLYSIPYSVLLNRWTKHQWILCVFYGHTGKGGIQISAMPGLFFFFFLRKSSQGPVGPSLPGAHCQTNDRWSQFWILAATRQCLNKEGQI